MSNLKKAVFFGLAGWGTLAGSSILQYQKILAQSCYFSNGWLSCVPRLTNAGSKSIVIILLFIIFSCLVCSGIFVWKAYTNSEKLESNKKIFGIAAVFILLSFFVVPFASGDVVYYFYAGKAISGGANVFTADWPRENYFVQPTLHVLENGFPYAPIMARVFSTVYDLSRGSVLMFILLWKLIIIFFFSLCGWLIYKFLDFSVDDPKKNFFWLLWFLQPALLFDWVASGHFDSIWLVFIILALILAKRKQWWLVLPCLVVGVWIKFIPVFFIPLFAVKWWQEVNLQNWKKMLGAQMVGVALSIGITILSWANFWEGFTVFRVISSLSKWAVNSTFAVVYYSLAPLFRSLLEVNFHWYLTRFVQLGLVGLILYLMYPFLKKAVMVILKKGIFSESDFLVALFISMAVYLIFWQKAIWPWYVAWLFPLGLMAYIKSQNQYLKNITAWITLSPLFFYFVWMLNFQITDGGDATIALWFYYYVVISIFVYPIYNIFKLRKQNFNIG